MQELLFQKLSTSKVLTTGKKIMELSFEKRWYDLHEIKAKFKIKDKTMLNWLYDKKTGKKKNLSNMGIYKLPDTNYYVVNPVEFQEWFNKRIGAYQ